MENWICPECLEKYEIGQDGHKCKMGICPMCHEFRNLIKTEPLKESGLKESGITNQEGIECLVN